MRARLKSKCQRRGSSIISFSSACYFHIRAFRAPWRFPLYPPYCRTVVVARSYPPEIERVPILALELAFFVSTLGTDKCVRRLKGSRDYLEVIT